MTKNEVIEELGRERAVERLIADTCRGITPSDAADLSQMVYVIMLETAEDKIVAARVEGWLEFFVRNIIKNIYKAPRGAFRYTFNRFPERNIELKEGIINEWDEENAPGWGNPR